jgi:hypothetical protein
VNAVASDLAGKIGNTYSAVLKAKTCHNNGDAYDSSTCFFVEHFWKIHVAIL